ncbi:MAG: alpha-ketoglutarate-dependent dioxygenase AlkB [Deltaproteobacteria bacterium]|nr:alpha-ketoglutarate-dependent dioxygenase AlkB [Deltaproteobacteria bacterium]
MTTAGPHAFDAPMTAPETDDAERIDLGDGAWLRYIPSLYPPSVADELLAAVRDEVAWEQLKIYGHPEARLTAWIGGFTYRYSGKERKPKPWTPTTRLIRTDVEARVFGASGGQYRGVLLNRYRDGSDKVGAHSDGEADLLRDAPIASVSLGAERRFVLRHNTTKEQRVIVLGHGSLLIMGGATQRFWKHELPRDAKCTGERINLTFRQHRETSPTARSLWR